MTRAALAIMALVLLSSFLISCGEDSQDSRIGRVVDEPTWQHAFHLATGNKTVETTREFSPRNVDSLLSALKGIRPFVWRWIPDNQNYGAFYWAGDSIIFLSEKPKLPDEYKSWGTVSIPKTTQ